MYSLSVPILLLTLHTILNMHLNNKLYTSELIKSPLCYFCKHENETTLNIFHFCNPTRRLWSQLKLFLEPNLILSYLLLQIAIFGFLDKRNNQKILLLNLLLLLFKLNVYHSWNDTVLCFNQLLTDITKKEKKMEKRQTFQSQTEITKYETKWKMTDQKIVVWNIIPNR